MSQVGGLPSLFGISGEVIASTAEIAPGFAIPLTLLGGGKKKRKNKTKRKKNTKRKNTKRKKNTKRRNTKKRVNKSKRDRKTLESLRATLNKTRRRRSIFNL